MPKIVFNDGTERQFNFDPALVARLLHLSAKNKKYRVVVDEKISKEQNDQVQTEIEKIWNQEDGIIVRR